jgi:DNA mismatch repair protein MutL
LPADQYASYVLYLTIDPACVDVNVHPTKHEIRFNQTRMVHDFIVSVLSRRLSPAEDSYQTTYAIDRHESVAKEEFDVNDQTKGVNNLYHQPQNTATQNTANSIARSNSQSVISKELELDKLDYNFPNKRSEQEIIIENNAFKGQILSLIGHHLIAKEDQNLWFVDTLKLARHINFTRINDKILNDNDNFELQQYKLLIPQSISLSARQCDILIKWQAEISLFAIDFTLSSDESMMLRAIPRLAFAVKSQLMLLSLADYLLTTNKKNNKQKHFYQAIVKIVADAIDESQLMDVHKQTQIMNHLVKFKDSIELKNCYQILNEIEINKLIIAKK